MFPMPTEYSQCLCNFSLCQATFIILLTASILVTAKQYMGGLDIHQFTKRQRGRQRKRQIQAICWWVRPKYTKREVIWAMPERKHFVSGSGPLEVNTKITLKVPNVQKTYTFVTSSSPGDPIDCIVGDAVPSDVMDTYCWIHSTFT